MITFISQCCFPRWLVRLHQFGHGAASGFDEVVGTAGEVGDGGFVRIDAEVVVKGGKDFAKSDGTLVGFAAESVGGADGLASFHAAAGEQSAGDARPMIAAGVGVDFWSAAEFSPNNKGNVFVHAALVKVIDQGGDALVEQWHVFAASFEVAVVPVPAAEGEGDATGAGFHQTAGDEEVFEIFGAAVRAVLWIAFAVFFADAGGFAGDVEGFGEFGGGKNAKSLLGEGVQPFHRAAGIEVASEAVKAGQQAAAVVELIQSDAVQGHVFFAKSVGLEGSVGGAEEAGFAGVGPAHLSHFGSEADKGRHFRSDGLVEFGEDGAEGGPTAGRGFGASERASGHALIGVVVGIGADDGANDCQAVHDGGHFGKVFADLDAGDFGGNGFEFSSNFRRRLCF